MGLYCIYIILKKLMRELLGFDTLGSPCTFIVVTLQFTLPNIRYLQLSP